MLYEFINKIGHRRTEWFSASDVPEPGQTIEREGQLWTRIISTGVENGSAYDSQSYPKISNTLPLWSDGCEHVAEKGRHHGKCIIKSRRQEDELCRMHAYTRDYHHTDNFPEPL